MKKKIGKRTCSKKNDEGGFLYRRNISVKKRLDVSAHA